MKQRPPPIINIIEQPRSSSLIYFLNSYIESLSVLQKGDNVGFLSLRLSNLEILKTTLQNDKRNIFTKIFQRIRKERKEHGIFLQTNNDENLEESVIF